MTIWLTAQYNSCGSDGYSILVALASGNIASYLQFYSFFFFNLSRQVTLLPSLHFAVASSSFFYLFDKSSIGDARCTC